MLEMRNVRKVYNPATVRELCLFDDFNLSVPEGQFVSVVGSNGSGKTSMLNILCGSIPVDGGSIFLEGRDISREREYVRARLMGRVYQNPSMGTCGSMTILENLSLADNKGKPYNLRFGTDRRRIGYYQELLAPLGLGLEKMLHARVGNLSGGQRQALSLIMSAMTPIRFLILDEHTAALDPKTAEVIMALTDRIVREKKRTALMVTHNLRYALEYGDRILMMHQGGIVLDRSGNDKHALSIDDVLKIFNEISIECGN